MRGITFVLHIVSPLTRFFFAPVSALDVYWGGNADKSLCKTLTL